MLLNKKRIGFLAIMVLSVFLLQMSPASAVPRATKTSDSIQVSASAVETDYAAVSAVKAAIKAAGTMSVDEDTHTNVLTLAQKKADSVASGVQVSMARTANAQVASDGTITYGSIAVTGQVTFKLTKNGASATQAVKVYVPATSIAPAEDQAAATDRAQVEAVKAAFAAAGTMSVSEGKYTNVLAIAQNKADAVAPGVTVTIASSANAQVGLDGTITYGSTAVSGDVNFLLTKNEASATQAVRVYVAASLISSDAAQIAAAQAALAAAGTLQPVENTNPNVLTMAQAIVDKAGAGAIVTIASSANAQVALDGTITYGSTAVTGAVNFTLTKNAATANQAVAVAVPARAKTSAELDAEQMAKAQAALGNSLSPVYGTDSDIVVMAQNRVNAASSGVIVKIAFSSNLTAVTAAGIINYTTTAATSSVTFSLTNPSLTASQTVAAAVPAKPIISGYNVKNYGALGNGTTDDTVAIQKTLDYVASIGGGTVYIPDGTYLINVSTPLKPKSNTTVSLAPNAVLKAKATSLSQFTVMTIKDASNVTVTGGSVVGERNEHLGTTGEGGMGIVIVGSTNVTISDITTRDCWGDGIYVAGSSLKTYSENVIIERFVSDNNRRQGISIISVKGLIIRNGTVSNTHGTAPECGIDLEPNNVSQFMQNVLIENVTAINNNLYGLGFGYYIYQNSTVPSDVTVKNLNASGNKAGAYNDYTKYLDQYCRITFI